MRNLLPANITNILVTGGAGFIGGEVIRLLLNRTNTNIFNLDKIGYASDLEGIQRKITSLGNKAFNRHTLLKVNLLNKKDTYEALKKADPDIILHLAAESHVDRSIDSPEEFIQNNIVGTYNLLDSALKHYQSLKGERKNNFRFHHISTDEVFGALGDNGQFDESTPYDPRSPYSASKAGSDHLVSAWNHTFGLPTIITNCSNNYGPWQFPEKLIPTVILKAYKKEPIPLYGDGKNIRDWLYVEDHAEAILYAVTSGKIGESYCIGGLSEKTNKEVVHTICALMNELRPANSPHEDLIEYVTDRPGHDYRYSINPNKINTELGWSPKFKFDTAISKTLNWYIKNISWCEEVKKKAKYDGFRIGLNA